MQFYTLFFLIFALLLTGKAFSNECVILLHGLRNNSSAMAIIEQRLLTEGYFVANIDYPSTDKYISELADLAIPAGLSLCEKNHATPVNIFAHSLGGILIREYASRHAIPLLKNVVMLAPPNGGSELSQFVKHIPFYGDFYGYPYLELGTEENDLPKRLGAVNFPLGIIAGNQSSHFFYSLYISGTDDGRVSLANARVKGMKAFIIVNSTHEFMNENIEAIDQGIHFIKYGKFIHPHTKKLTQ